MFRLAHSRGIGPAELADERFARQRGISALRRRPSKAGAVSGLARTRGAVVPFCPAVAGFASGCSKRSPANARDAALLRPRFEGTNSETAPRSVHRTRARQNFVPSAGRGRGTTCGSLVGANEMMVAQLVWLSEVIS